MGDAGGLVSAYGYTALWKPGCYNSFSVSRGLTEAQIDTT